MQTRSSSRLVSNPSSNPTLSTNLNPKGRNRKHSKQRIEEFNLDKLSPPIVMMDDQRTMAQLLQAPTEGYEDAIIVPAITADKLKHGLLTLVQNKQIHQLDTFYDAFNLKDQDSLNSAAGGNFLDKMPRECLAIIEIKSKVHYSHNKPVVAIVSMNTSTSGISPDVAKLKDMVKALLLDKKSQNQSPAIEKAVEESCVTCGGAHSYLNFSATNGNVYRDNIQEFVSQASAVNYNQRNTSYRPPMISNQIRPPVSASRPNLRPPIPYPSRMQEQKLGDKANDQRKFLIPCDFPRKAKCLALADLCASINLMPLSVWNKLSLPDLSATYMTLELADRSISHSIGVAEDVYTKRAFIDVFKGELTLRAGKEAITFNLNHTSIYSANYNEMTAKRIDVIDMACEEYSQEVLEAFLNDDPSLPPPAQGNYLPEVRKELKICEAKSNKSSIDEPLEVELKDLPPHLEYVFLEGDEKLPVIITKDLSVEEKTALITVLKSHKRAIAWKLSDIKGIDPEFCAHKILMEEDFEPAVQHHRRVNPKIYNVIKQEVLKLLDNGLIYPISNSPWVSPVHCVPKKGGFIIVENEDNELILTRLVTGWRVYIDYRKLNEATHQEKTTFTCPYGTSAYRRMPFGLCNAAGTFQRMLKRCEDTNLCLNWEKSHFMVKEGIVLGHKISKQVIEVDKAKVDVITKLPHPTTVKGIRSFLGHADFYRRFIKDFSKIARSMTRLLEKETPFIFSKECVEAF
nr:reverse transcriptase domain-containing protein [Tanacetum cinerariifolium]